MLRGEWRKRMLAVGLGLGLATLLLVVIEVAFYGLNHLRDGQTTIDEPYLFAFSETMGYTSLPNAEGRAIKRHGDDIVFDVVYRTDAHGRRVTPQPSRDSPPDRFLAFMGCSFTFGHGIAESETLPAQMQSLVLGARVYNYGFSGYGPQQALVKIQSGDLRQEIPETSGTLVYVFMDHHVHRAIGSMRVWTQWGRHFPFFDFDESNQVQLQGTFLRERPTRSRVYDLLSHEQVTRFFHVDFPPVIRPHHLDLTAAIIAESRHAFLEAYPEGRFLLLAYPRSPGVHIDRDYLFRRLREEDVEIVDLSSLIDLSDERYQIPFDNHPTAAAHAAVAAALTDHLGARDG